MRYLAALLIAFLPLAFRADDKRPTHDELLIQAADKGPALATEYTAGLRRAIATATHARLVVYVGKVAEETNPIDRGTFLTMTDLSMLRELVDQLEFDPSKLPHRDQQDPRGRIVMSTCMCISDYVVLLYRSDEIIAAIDFCHNAHTRVRDFTERVEFPEFFGAFDYRFTQAGGEKVRAWEEKYHIKELVRKHDAAQAPAKEQETK